MAPVIAVDGPSGSGKGSLCQALARELGWHLLDSGALYRIVGLAAVKRGTSFDDEKALGVLAAGLNVEFRASEPGEPAAVILDGEDISSEVRNETSASYASSVAVYSAVRDALTGLQRSFAEAPGLIADGRDMGTVIFPDAPLKIFLTASAAERAGRRCKQLLAKGESVSLPRLLEAIEERDARDRSRSVSPLVPAEDAIVVDSTGTPIAQVFDQVMGKVKERSLL
jgi:cytidylate kinase